MKLPVRSHILFVVAVLAATFGVGQIWGLALALRSGAADSASVVAAGFGLLLVVTSGTVLGRFFYVLSRLSRASRIQKEEVPHEGNSQSYNGEA